jgi:hypothetical protein
MDQRNAQQQNDLKNNPASPQAQTKNSKSVLDMKPSEMVDAFEGTTIGSTRFGKDVASKARQLIGGDQGASQQTGQESKAQAPAPAAEATGRMVPVDQVPKEIKDKLKPGGSVQIKSGTLKFDGANYTLIPNK